MYLTAKKYYIFKASVRGWFYLNKYIKMISVTRNFSSSSITNLMLDGDLVVVFNALCEFQFSSRLRKKASLWVCWEIFVQRRPLWWGLLDSWRPPSPEADGGRTSPTAPELDKENPGSTCSCLFVSRLFWRCGAGGSNSQVTSHLIPKLLFQLQGSSAPSDLHPLRATSRIKWTSNLAKEKFCAQTIQCLASAALLPPAVDSPLGSKQLRVFF